MRTFGYWRLARLVVLVGLVMAPSVAPSFYVECSWVTWPWC